jgi:hypothetical protein
MQVVLYTDEMEAITVIDIPQWLLERVQDGQMIRLAVIEPPQVSAALAQEIPTPSPMRCVEIWAEKFRRKGRETWLLFTRDEEAALILKSDMLPGQRKAFQDEYRRGFVTAILRALGHQ